MPLYENPAAAELPPFDVVILGMGTDGHTASFFPGGDNLATALDPETTERIVTMTAPGAGEPRLTFTLARPHSIRGYLVLHIEGAEKRKVLDTALKDGPVEAMPIRAVLRSQDAADALLVPLTKRLPMPVHSVVAAVTEKIVARSSETRRRYLDRIEARRRPSAEAQGAGLRQSRPRLCRLRAMTRTHSRNGAGPNLGIVTAYNDMLSAHQPFERYPDIIRAAAREAGGTAQVAGGVPAMCDGVTQGETGMELSLFSRDVIALSTAVALSHQMFDAAVYLGVCDKIVPGLIIGALSFGHLPAVFIPAGPMTSGLPNDEKAQASASSMPKARSAATRCSSAKPSPITAPAPAPSTAPPIPTRC